MKKPTIGVIGIGEVGSAIAQIFEKKFRVLKKDISYDEIKNSKLEVLHVCVPYNSRFEKSVTSQIRKSKPALVIINSTVKPGTTANIFKKTGTAIVHSPVMGTHPNLKRDILKFTKFIGPTSKESANLAQNHFKIVGIKTTFLRDSFETELAKLLATTYYAWNIVFNKIVAQVCQDLKVNFENVYTKFNQAYNEGYKISKPNVVRPVLKFQKGPIGGNCVAPNAQILDQFRKSPLTDFILKFNKELEKGSQ
mgnify:FL=1